MNRILFLIIIFLGINQCLFAQSGIEANLLSSAFNTPVSLAHNGGPGLFVVEKSGRVKFFDPSSNAEPVEVMDIRSRVKSNRSEQGLLGLAFHPDFPESNYVYVNYINSGGNTQISRFTVVFDPEFRIDEESEKQILSFNQPNDNHNAGDLSFGPDGMLYLTSGDGGGGGDPDETGQDRLSLLGKILRIDIDNGDPYAIPEDNPFAMDDFTLDEIWALGLRNPWRMSFDRETGDLWIGDVGQGKWEEINFQPADSPGGENYGWDCFEADEAFESDDCPDIDELTFPVFAYRHNGGNGCSVTGGYVYRGEGIPSRQGQYIFGDYCSGRVWALESVLDAGWTEEIILETDANITTFGEDADGELYYATMGGQLFVLESTITSTTESQLVERLSIWPNPVNDQATVQIEVAKPGKFQFSLWDAQGRLLRSWEENIIGQYQDRLSLVDFPSGSYTLVLENGNQRATKRFQKR